MKIGIFFDNVKEAYSDIDDELVLLEKVTEMGYEYIELDCDILMEKSQEFFDKARELSIGFSVYAFADENCVIRNGVKAKDCLQFLNEHDVKNLMMVCKPSDENQNAEEINKKIICSLNHLCDCATKYDVQILVEDFDNSIPCGSCEDMLYFGSNVPKLKFTFDTGNFAYFGEDELASFEKLKDRIGHVHLKDRVSSENLKVTTTGKGSLPIEQIIKNLLSNSYDGTMSVEMFGASNEPGELIESLNFVKEVIKYTVD